MPTRRDLLRALGAAGMSGPLQVSLGALVSLAAPAASGRAEAAVPLRVVATTGMIADAATALAGPVAEVRGLMGPGVDPHLYRQTRADIAALARADIAFWNGLYLEAQMEDLFTRLAARQRVVAVGEAVPPDELIAHPTYAGRHDPHVWMVPRLWDFAVARIGRVLAEARSDAAPDIEGRAERYRREMARVGTYAREVLAEVPAEHRVLVTAHDAFGYFGREYGFEVVGVQGISTESEAGLYRIRELVEIVVARRLPAIFVESSVSERSIRAVLEGARARGHEVRIGGLLYSDAMGQPGTYEGTYVGMIDHNVTTIARALGAGAPARGLNGRLSPGA